MRWLVVILAMVVAVPTAQAFSDYYMRYKPSRTSSLILVSGPYPSLVKCSAARFKLPVGAVFIECVR